MVSLQNRIEINSGMVFRDNLYMQLDQFFPGPYKLVHHKVMNSTDMCFDFITPLIYNESDHLFNKYDMQAIVNLMNGIEHFRIDEKLKYDYDTDSIHIKIDDVWKRCIIIRGGGNLMGSNGHNLDKETAYQIKAMYAEFIIYKLTKLQ